MRVLGLLFDLDDTLLIDQPWVDSALESVCGSAAGELRVAARAAWHAQPCWEQANALGISSWEALVSDDLGPVTVDLDAHRAAVWTSVLGSGGLAAAARYRALRRSNYRWWPDAASLWPSLTGLRVGIVTNGPRDLQREKIAALGLSVDAVVISSDIGAGKPSPTPFLHALDLLGLGVDDVVMIGDSLGRDVAGAGGVGMRSVWVNRWGATVPQGHASPTWEIPDLSGLPAILAG